MVKTVRKAKVILLVLFVLLSVKSAYAETIIPTASITLDGNPSDWSSIDPVYIDAQGDDNTGYTGADIKSFKFAQDSNYLYVMADFYDGIPNTALGQVDFWAYQFHFTSIDANGDPSPIHIDDLGIFYDGSKWDINYLSLVDGVSGSLTGSSVAVDSVIELQVPKNKLPNSFAFCLQIGTDFGINGVLGDITEWRTLYQQPTPESALLQKYAPVLYFHDKEELYPWGVYSMLDYSDLKNGTQKSKPQLEDLEKTKYDTVEHYLDLYDVGPWDEPDKPAEKDRWNDYDYWVYARNYEPPPHDDKIILQYWFFYPYNDWYNNHEGDWEMIQITLGKSSAQPEKISYSHHRSGNWDNWTTVDLFQGTHPKIFITKGAHGCWITSGDHGLDETSDTGMILHPDDYSLCDMTASHPWDPVWPLWAHGKGDGEREFSRDSQDLIVLRTLSIRTKLNRSQGGKIL